MKTWRVIVPVDVTADTREDAIQFALDDLRDPTCRWEDGHIEAQQTDGPHPPHGPGLCPICGHHGDDCLGTEPTPPRSST